MCPNHTRYTSFIEPTSLTTSTHRYNQAHREGPKRHPVTEIGLTLMGLRPVRDSSDYRILALPAHCLLEGRIYLEAADRIVSLELVPLELSLILLLVV